MAAAGTTQMETPSDRRVYRSRALRRAMAASGACRLPACVWDSPRRGRMKTSHSGQLSDTRQLPLSSGIGSRGLAYPRAIVVRPPAVRHALPVARAVAADDTHQLVVVWLGVVVCAALGIPAQLGVGQRQAEHAALLGAHVDEPLAQLVVGEPLDLPCHRLRRMR